MISEEYIMSLVEQYAKSKEGKAAIKKVYGVDYDDTGASKQKMVAYGNKMKGILFEHISQFIKSITMDDIIVGSPIKDKYGKTSLAISFREGSLHRDSLYSEGYPNGIENIVLLFANGYHAKNYVYGTNVRGQSIRSKKDREPEDFLNRAVAEFNSFAGDFAFAKLEGNYNN